MTITETAIAYRMTGGTIPPMTVCDDCFACFRNRDREDDISELDTERFSFTPIAPEPGDRCHACGMASIWTTWTGFEWLTNANTPMAVHDADTAELIPDIDLTRELFDASAKAGAEGIVLVDEDGFLVYDGANGRRVYVGVA
jgi:hypothetical protein